MLSKEVSPYRKTIFPTLTTTPKQLSVETMSDLLSRIPAEQIRTLSLKMLSHMLKDPKFLLELTKNEIDKALEAQPESFFLDRKLVEQEIITLKRAKTHCNMLPSITKMLTESFSTPQEFLDHGISLILNADQTDQRRDKLTAAKNPDYRIHLWLDPELTKKKSQLVFCIEEQYSGKEKVTTVFSLGEL